MAERRGLSFRGSAISFALMTVAVALLAGFILILLDPRAQAYWGAKFSDLGTAAQALWLALLERLPGR